MFYTVMSTVNYSMTNGNLMHDFKTNFNTKLLFLSHQKCICALTKYKKIQKKDTSKKGNIRVTTFV